MEGLCDLEPRVLLDVLCSLRTDHNEEAVGAAGKAVRGAQRSDDKGRFAESVGKRRACRRSRAAGGQYKECTGLERPPRGFVSQEDLGKRINV